MKHTRYRFSSNTTDFYFEAAFPSLKKIVSPANAVLVTDTNVFRRKKKIFAGWECIVIKAGEKNKVQSTADHVISKLITIGANRSTILIGVGGGVVTDITGYVASIYMRGIRFGFVPTTILAMVDACIGGKNGVDVGEYKNMVGTITQPSFILYDTGLLDTLPGKEWRNGFAEIIKHACIRDAKMFKDLEAHSIGFYKENTDQLVGLIKRNAQLKIKVVKADEREEGERKMLNFGHTLGHALENQYKLMHGEAISIGMAAAAKISSSLNGFKNAERVTGLLRKYSLPVHMDFDRTRTFELMTRDKKGDKKEMNYIVLEKIGKAEIARLSLTKLRELIARV